MDQKLKRLIDHSDLHEIKQIQKNLYRQQYYYNKGWNTAGFPPLEEIQEALRLTVHRKDFLYFPYEDRYDHDNLPTNPYR